MGKTITNFPMRFPGGKARALTLSYDDGVTTDAHLAALMRAHGVKGTFNINTGMFADTPQTYETGKWGRMTRQECIDLYGDDMEIALHARTHPFLERLPAPNAMQEVLSDRAEIERMTDRPARGMAYPFGTYSDDVVEILRMAGIAYARTTVSTERFAIPTDWLRMSATCHHANPKLMALAEQFLAPVDRYGAPKLFYLWGHSYEYERDGNWSIIERFLEFIGGRDDIWYATNIEIYDYVTAFRALQWTLDFRIVHNPTALDVWVSAFSAGNPPRERIMCIPAGQTVAVEQLG